MMGNKERFINLLEEQIQKAYEDENASSLEWNHEITITLRQADDLITFLRSQEVKEPLEDVVFFVGKPSLDSIVYHVLCRKVTLDAMRKDHNIHFMRLQQFNGVMEQDKGDMTLDEQENRIRKMLTGGECDEQ